MHDEELQTVHSSLDSNLVVMSQRTRTAGHVNLWRGERHTEFW
jgi:hypothetical protein